MEIHKFALGIRIEMFKKEYSDEALSYELGRVFSAISDSILKDLELFSGKALIDDSDSDTVYTLVFMNGNVKRMRKLYAALDSDAYVKSILARFRPYIQTNAITKIECLTYRGKFNSKGRLMDSDHAFDVQYLRASAVHGKEYEKLTLLVAPDKFKGSLTAECISKIIMRVARKVLPAAKVVTVPIADGGDGTVNVLVNAFNGIKRKCTVKNAYGEPIEAEYGIINGDTAVIEMAVASGIAKLDKDMLDPMKASSFGTGELIMFAANEGVKRILIGIGGSATNDGGMGAAIALGVKFFDDMGNELTGCGENMGMACTMDASAISPILEGIDIRVMCDVNNPLTGENGATRIFGPQKGATAQQLDLLEQGMCNLETLYNAYCGFEVCTEPGCGAAGGLGAMLKSILRAQLSSGAETVLDAVHFEQFLSESDMLITAEGCLDSSSVKTGKAIGTVLRYAANYHVPAAVIAGSFGKGYESIAELGDFILKNCVNAPMTLEYAMSNAEYLLERATEDMFRGMIAQKALAKR